MALYKVTKAEDAFQYFPAGHYDVRCTRLHTADDKSFVIHPEFVNDFENEDYNNAYYNVTVIEE